MTMRLPRKGILIRIAVYGTLIGYFGWQAYEKREADQAAKKVVDDPSVTPGSTRSFTMPDGRTIEVLEVTPEQAKTMFGNHPRDSADPTKPALPPTDRPAATPDAAP